MSITSSEATFLREILLNALNEKQRILLSEIAKGEGNSLSLILRRVAKEHGIPLSTLKFNSSKLTRLGLIERYGVNGRRMVKLTKLGLKIYTLINGVDVTIKSVRYSHLDDEIKKVEATLEDILTSINGFHAFSSQTALSIIFSIFMYNIENGVKAEEVDLILSKGHAAPALYAVLKYLGILKEKMFVDAFKAGSFIQSHPIKGCPTVKVSTGSLGQGLSIANGLALSYKLDGRNKSVYVVLGDGELDEGQVWEALATASSNNLDNIYLLIDRNWMQLTDNTENIKSKEPLDERLEAFGWITKRVNSKPSEIAATLEELSRISGWPKALVVERERS